MACAPFRKWRFRTKHYGTNGRFRRLLVSEGGFVRYLRADCPIDVTCCGNEDAGGGRRICYVVLAKHPPERWPSDAPSPFNSLTPNFAIHDTSSNLTLFDNFMIIFSSTNPSLAGPIYDVNNPSNQIGTSYLLGDPAINSDPIMASVNSSTDLCWRNISPIGATDCPLPDARYCR